MPAKASCRIAVAVKTLLIDPMLNSVVTVLGRFVARSAMPYACSNTIVSPRLSPTAPENSPMRREGVEHLAQAIGELFLGERRRGLRGEGWRRQERSRDKDGE